VVIKDVPFLVYKADELSVKFNPFQLHCTECVSELTGCSLHCILVHLVKYADQVNFS